MWRYKDEYGWRLSLVEEIYDEAYIIYGTPAWSLNRLLSMLPSDAPKIYWILNGANISIEFEDDGADFFPHNGDIYEGIVKCIEWLIKEEYFNKEYLI